MELHSQSSFGERFSEVTIQLCVMIALLVGLVITVAMVNPNFLTAFSVRSVTRDVAIMSLFALGQGIVIISGGIDLSVGSLMAFFGALAVILVGHNYEYSFGFVAVGMIGLATVVGAAHALFVCQLKLQPFLVTLCSLLVFRGLARVITKDSTVAFVAADDQLFFDIGSGAIWGVPIPVYILLAVIVPLGFFMKFTVPGRYMYAIGYNIEAARLSGIRVHALQTLAYVISAVLAAIAGLLEASDIGSVTPSSAGMAYEMYGITAAVLGGCALRGGQGSLIGVVIGAAILRVIRSAVIFLGISTYWTFAVTGLVLLVAVTVDSLVRNPARHGLAIRKSWARIRHTFQRLPR